NTPQPSSTPMPVSTPTRMPEVVPPDTPMPQATLTNTPTAVIFFAPTSTPQPTNTWTLTPVPNSPTPIMILPTVVSFMPQLLPDEVFKLTRLILCKDLIWEHLSKNEREMHFGKCKPDNPFYRYQKVTESLYLFAEFSFVHPQAKFLILDYAYDQVVWAWTDDKSNTNDLYYSDNLVQLRPYYIGLVDKNFTNLGMVEGTHTIQLYIFVSEQKFLVGQLQFYVF
ncbi:MAG: hypothetical protein WCV41_03720, partial [Patescibacteria group bacterium]